jgi:hypothetical protein
MTASHMAAAFRRQIDRWVLAAAKDGVDSFDKLIRALPGVYPTVVADRVAQLRDLGATDASIHARLSSRAPERAALASPGHQLLPAPHPLDFDWRYAPAAIDVLLRRIAQSTDPGELVVLLGAPSLYVAASQRAIDRRFVLIDANLVTLDAVSGCGTPDDVLRCDLLTEDVPEMAAAVVVADPPWYPEHIEAFMFTAARAARAGARVLVSMPGPGTRPGVHRERADFSRHTAAQGLRHISTRRGALAYTSPPFEINALAAAGWHDLPMDWRRGDLVVLEASGAAPFRLVHPPAPSAWQEARLGWFRIRVRVEADDGQELDPRLSEVVPGDILDDVSRRHPLRGQVVVWTSGNRVFGCSSPSALFAIVDALAADRDPVDAVAVAVGRSLNVSETKKTSHAVSQIQRVARLEAQELAAMGWARAAVEAERMAS